VDLNGVKTIFIASECFFFPLEQELELQLPMAFSGARTDKQFAIFFFFSLGANLTFFNFGLEL